MARARGVIRSHILQDIHNQELILTRATMDDPMHRRFTTPLHLFQLDAHEIIVDLVNAQLAHPSHDIADAADVPFECLEAVHMLLARPLDFPELAIPAILQRTGDVPLHSTDRLILIDTVYHHHSSGSHVHSRPTVVRTVHRLPHQVIRPQILTVAAVYQYCQFLQENCEVFLDDRRWPSTELEPRPLRHGSYARIEVPPPAGYDVDTFTAAATVQDDADSNTFMDFLQKDLGEDDAMFLAQVTAGRVFNTQHLCKVRSILQSTCLDILPELAGDHRTRPLHFQESAALQVDTIDMQACNDETPLGNDPVHLRQPSLSHHATDYAHGPKKVISGWCGDEGMLQCEQADFFASFFHHKEVQCRSTPTHADSFYPQ